MAGSGATFFLKQNDLLPPLAATVVDQDGNAVDISAASGVTFRFRRQGGVSTEAAATITDAANGKVQYDWVAGDTANSGLYEGEFIVTFPGPEPQTFPSRVFILFEVVKNLT